MTLVIGGTHAPHTKLSSKGWAALSPGKHERTVMRKKCGNKCFLGPVGEGSFPICAKGTCKINKKGIYAAYVRAREYASTKMKRCTKRWPCSKKHTHKRRTKRAFRSIAARAKKMLKSRGFIHNLRK